MTWYRLEILTFLSKMYVNLHQTTRSICHLDQTPFPMLEIHFFIRFLDRNED